MTDAALPHTARTAAPEARASLAFFARHEARLVWREWLWWLKRGRRGALIAALVGLFVYGVMHAAAGFVVTPFADLPRKPNAIGYLMLAAAGMMSFMLLLSQAIESVTRVLYARGDVELVMSSPAPAESVFALRLLMLAGAETALAVFILGPFVNMLALRGGIEWLAAYGFLAAMGPLATAFAIFITLALFQMAGARRARLVAQLAAAIIGGSMVIALQIAAIFGHRGLDRFAALHTQAALSLAPPLDSPLWLPVRAAMGAPLPLLLYVAISLLLLALAVLVAARSFARHVIAAAGVPQGPARQRRGFLRFNGTSPRAVLRAKELALVARDPWLLSQSLMQILYLIPPAVMLWQSFGDGSNSAALIVPVIVMAAGQLAGGLAWLAISGEDAPDLMMTAPISPRFALMAKIEAVMIALALPLLPLVAAIALVSAEAALACLTFGIAAAAGSTAVQLMFRAQAKRTAFRRRQTASRISTIAEALSSITWAGASGLAASGNWLLAAFPAAIALAILGGMKAIAAQRR